jgi:hypothetical protein
MDVYVNQIVGNGQPHDYFYTNEKVLVSIYVRPSITPNLLTYQGAYKNYVKIFVSRYVNEPTIMVRCIFRFPLMPLNSYRPTFKAWELGENMIA